VEWLEDDSIPYLDVYTGTEIFAEAFGCQVYRPEDNMPFAVPRIHSASEVAKLRVPDLSVAPLAMLFEIADELRRRAGKEAIVRLVDIQSPMDIAALIWDKNDLYVAIIDDPDAVKELAAKVDELMITFLDEWFARYGQEFIAHYPIYYMSQGITLSEDEVGAVDEEMFLEFYLPELVGLSERYGGIGIHCCADARHQWGNFKQVRNLRLLNLVQPVKELRAAYEFFATHVPQMHSWYGDGPAWTWPEQYPEGARVVMEANAASRDEALKLAERLHIACGRV
jgi:uroporphyrinogen-III decarboxylase